MLLKYIGIFNEKNEPISYFDGKEYNRNEPHLYNAARYDVAHVEYGSHLARNPKLDIRLLTIEVPIPPLAQLPSVDNINETRDTLSNE